ncbi:hypothetical protein [Campylobacter canadensis]|uniref:Cell division protein ZapB n=1 Tax=Campylobacter canadensis TaxID=449520 RepID=A0ABS7WS46_9BACT|nr:hypothetical protein [Campylobacter canadensis]MBZ7987201.1 hypothetical protein [Campylobacter canadensis]MBZ7994447.1 hypothetical protein [Campylobacter canadensis]MBZ7996466.1 hypothetical protein [Campylobacter canadensis]MBZ7998175.1 hypothetical protein [Campylobacter canadensis]MBZ7999838.1 hypothetical protein [Campylobacter canadensis]
MNEITSTLSTKIADLIAKYNNLKAENENLRNELIQAKALASEQKIEIEKLENEVLEKQLVLEDIEKSLEQVFETN